VYRVMNVEVRDPVGSEVDIMLNPPRLSVVMRICYDKKLANASTIYNHTVQQCVI
jgi:hypothetical protein